MQEFDSIRPYSDEETAPTIQRLVNDPEFLNMIGRFQSPRLAAWAPAPLRFYIRRWLLKRFGHIKTVDDLQMSVSGYVGELVENTTLKVTHSGLENLSKTNAHLFISNHRDIVFDPMIVNYLLFQNGFQTTRIAIGDNLLSNRVFAEMMKLNKSFLVRRNITSPREMRDAYLTLSGFINHSIDTNHSVWIAQREGRAKDGIDATDPAIIKMFYMSKKKSGLGFDEALSRLHIVPVSISYEYDPCDVDKARELEIRDRTGEYQKAEGEDSEQIMKGLTGPKGHVHVHFGAPISKAPNTPKELAAHIDHEMHANYHLHASNLAAYEMRNLQVETPETANRLGIDAIAAGAYSNEEREEAKAEITRRLEACDAAGRKYLLDMYANPVVNALAARRHSESTEAASD
ncbi:1-acyl-sn-glycerol-3-phosphate acyltransferase [Marinobacter litoralis]|uniref:1-acyl-sn-glycerol-3-phosphate acyltransferase n=1 Tax=Marinobacter litoralis TaxID=187981 RepID=UPI0018EE1E06|nr:1-acyl-sn-glycerol-3-phosphate acyltransferase [Marinobacter litoralis]MBJ6137875.1 1-acyl-sn-glycerol-3-phosphate acyltransferase [Marinobacter litoralis]